MILQYKIVIHDHYRFVHQFRPQIKWLPYQFCPISSYLSRIGHKAVQPNQNQQNLGSDLMNHPVRTKTAFVNRNNIRFPLTNVFSGKNFLFGWWSRRSPPSPPPPRSRAAPPDISWCRGRRLFNFTLHFPRVNLITHASQCTVFRVH